MWVWTQSVGQLLPQTGRHVLPKDKGLRKPSPPLPLSPPPFSSHLLPPLPEGEAAASLRVSTPPKPAYPPGILGPRALAQAPAHPARGGSFPQARLHSGTRHWLDTAVNPAGRANSGHPQRELGAGPRWEILSRCCQVPRALLVPPFPTPNGFSVSVFIFLCLPWPPLPLERPDMNGFWPNKGPTLYGDMVG